MVCSFKNNDELVVFLVLVVISFYIDFFFLGSFVCKYLEYSFGLGSLYFLPRHLALLISFGINLSIFDEFISFFFEYPLAFKISVNIYAHMATRTQTQQEMADNAAAAAELRQRTQAARVVDSIPMEDITNSALGWADATVRNRDPHTRAQIFSGSFPGARSLHLRDLLARPNRSLDMDVVRSEWRTIGSLEADQRNVIPIHVTDVQVLGNDARIDDRLRRRHNERNASYAEVGAINLEFLSTANPDGDQVVGGLVLDCAHNRVPNMVRGAFVARVAGQPVRTIFYPRTRVRLDGTENHRFQVVMAFPNNDIVQGYEVGLVNASAISQNLASTSSSTPTSFLISQGKKTVAQAARYADQVVSTWHYQSEHDTEMPETIFQIPSSFSTNQVGPYHFETVETRQESLRFTHRIQKASGSAARHSFSCNVGIQGEPPAPTFSSPNSDTDGEAPTMGFLVKGTNLDQKCIYSGAFEIATSVSDGQVLTTVQNSSLLHQPTPQVYTKELAAKARAKGGFKVQITCQGAELSGIGLVFFQHNHAINGQTYKHMLSMNSLIWNPCRQHIVDVYYHPFPGFDSWSPNWLDMSVGSGFSIAAASNWAESPTASTSCVVEVFYDEQMVLNLPTTTITRALVNEYCCYLGEIKWAQNALFKYSRLPFEPSKVLFREGMRGWSTCQHALLGMSRTLEGDFRIRICKVGKSLVNATLCATLVHNPSEELTRSMMMRWPYQIVSFDLTKTMAQMDFKIQDWVTWTETESYDRNSSNDGLYLVLFAKDQVTSTVPGDFHCKVYLESIENMRCYGVGTGYTDVVSSAQNTMSQPAWPLVVRNTWYDALKIVWAAEGKKFQWQFLTEEPVKVSGAGPVVSYYSGPLMRLFRDSVYTKGTIKIRIVQQGKNSSLSSYSNNTVFEISHGKNALRAYKKTNWQPCFEEIFEFNISGRFNGALKNRNLEISPLLSVACSKGSDILSYSISFQLTENVKFFGV